MRRIRMFRKAQMSFSRVSRIFIAVCVGSMCLLGVRTFMSIDDNNVSRRPSGTTDIQPAKNESGLIDSPLNDALSAPDSPRKARRKFAQNPEDATSPRTVRGDAIDDSEQYPGFQEEKRLDGKAGDTLMANPALVSDQLGPGFEGVRRFPGSVDEVTELSLANRTKDAQLHNLELLRGRQKLAPVQIVNNGQNPWMPMPVANQPGQSVQLKIGPGSILTPETQFMQGSQFGAPAGVGAHFFDPAYGSPQAQPGGAAYFSPVGGQQQPPPQGKDPLPVQQKLVHFDLKGAPPKVSYFKEIFPMLKKLGATGLLMEYEDMFPFSGPYKIAQAGNAYSRGDIAVINKLAAENQLMVIPLVQTFGHLEFVLKHEPFKHIREIDNYASAVCPSRNESFGMVTDLIDQVLAMHPNVTYLHIGADEVFQLGACPICSERVKQNPGTGRHEIFLHYISQLIYHLRRRYPNIKPIMWDDMFHNMNPQTIRDGLGELVNYVEPMIWSYFTSWTNHLPQNGALYGPIFPNIWGATAFKGSDGETRQMPDIRTQVGIHTSWLEALRFGGRNFQNFRGIVLTGWSRYDHFFPLCELFPVSLPALAISMSVLNQNALTLAGVEEATKILNCQVIPNALSFMDYDPLLEQYTSCTFPGIDVYRSVHMIKGIEKPVKDYMEELAGKFPEYQMRHGYLQAWRLPEIISKIAGYEGLYEGYKKKSTEAFAMVFDEATYKEWMAINVDPLLKRLQAWRSLFENALKNSTWPARPLHIPQLPTKDPTAQFPAKNPFLPNWSPPPPLINLNPGGPPLDTLSAGIQPGGLPLNNGLPGSSGGPTASVGTQYVTNATGPPVGSPPLNGGVGGAPVNNGARVMQVNGGPGAVLPSGNNGVGGILSLGVPGAVPFNSGPGATLPRPTGGPLGNGAFSPPLFGNPGGAVFDSVSGGAPLQPAVPAGGFL